MDKDLLDLINNCIKSNEVEAKQLIVEQKKKSIEDLIHKSGLGRRFQKRIFSQFTINKENEKAYASALSFSKYFKEKEKGLLLIGGYGTGKTHLAAAVANYLMENLYTVVFGNITNIITTIRSTYRKDSEMKEEDIIDILTSVDLLIIDDLGKENATANTSTLIYQIVNRRYEDEKLIMVTTNLASKDLSKNLGDKGRAITSRLFEMCDIVEMNGLDWRLKK